MRTRILACFLATVALSRVTLAQATTQPSVLQAQIGEINFNSIALADVVEFLRDMSRANMVVDWKSLEKAGVDRNTQISARIADGTFEQALKAVCDSIEKQKQKSVSFIEDDGIVYIAASDDLKSRKPGQPIPARGDAKAAEQTLAALKRPVPEVNFNQIAAADCLEFIKDISRLTFDIKWDQLEKAGIDRNAPITARLRNVSMDRAMRTVLNDMDGGSGVIDYVVDGDHILISTRDDLMKK